MYRSLCIVALFAFSASARHIRSETTLSPEEEKCRVEHNISVDFVKNLSMQPSPLNDPKSRCYWTCVLMEHKLLNSDGSMNVQVIATQLPKEAAVDKPKIVAALQACANQPGKDVCEKAYNAYTCNRKQAVLRKYFPD